MCAGITPFQLSGHGAGVDVAAAIACGNAFVLKPSEQVPSASVRLAQIAGEAGLPDGVLNVVHGGVEAAEALIDHPDVAAVSFVGSTPVARAIYPALGRGRQESAGSQGRQGSPCGDTRR